MNRKLTENLDFSRALEFVKQGQKITREGWNGEGMFIFQGFPRVEINTKYKGSVTSMDATHYFGGHYSGPVLCMKTAQDNIVVGWLASQTDLLAEDWLIVE